MLIEPCLQKVSWLINQETFRSSSHVKSPPLPNLYYVFPSNTTTNDTRLSPVFKSRMSSSSSSIITVTVEKTSSQQTGLFLYQDEKGRIIINHILEGSIFANSKLKTSMEITSVNGMSCSSNTMTDDFLISFIDDIDGKVTVTARDVVFDAVVVEEENQQPIPSAPPPSTQQYPASNPTGNSAINPAYVGNTTINTTTITPTGNHNHNTSSNPPRGCREGGRWAVIKHSGDKTIMMCIILALCCCIFSLCGACAFFCPMDEKKVYLVDGYVYDASGANLGNVSKFQFV